MTSSNYDHNLENKITLKILNLIETKIQKLEQEIKAKDKQIEALKESNLQLTTSLNLLPQQQTPLEIKTEWEHQQYTKKYRAIAFEQLKKTSIFSFWKRKKLIQELEDYI